MILLAMTALLAQATPAQDWQVVYQAEGTSIAVQAGPEWSTHRRGMVAILVTQKGADGAAPSQTWREVAMSCRDLPSTVTYVGMSRVSAADPSTPRNVTMTDEYPHYMGRSFNEADPVHLAIRALCAAEIADAGVVRLSWADMLKQQREAVAAQ